MSPDQIKAAAIEAAAEAMWDYCASIMKLKRAWKDVASNIRAKFIDEATAAIAAYDRAMVRPLADAPDVPSGASIMALGWIMDGQYWAPVGVRLGRHGVGIAYRGGRVLDPSDVPFFHLLPDAPEPPHD